MSDDVLQHLHRLKDQASTRSAKIGEELGKGLTPDKLVPLLQDQSDLILELHTGILELMQWADLALHGEDVRLLQKAIGALSKAAEAQLQAATKKGVRLSGIGGKPHVTRRKPR
ncbi:MAG: hypothetical protein O3B73_13050 [bacterium]|nr:hypothetical protein [bacterium]